MRPGQRNYLQSLINIASNMKRRKSFDFFGEWAKWMRPYYEDLTEQKDKDKLMDCWETLKSSLKARGYRDYKLAEAMLRRMVWIENKR